MATPLTEKSLSTTPDLAVSIVCYSPDIPLLEQVLVHLGESIDWARRLGSLAQVELWLVDNGPGTRFVEQLRVLLTAPFIRDRFGSARLLTGHGNVGYGVGHNLAIQRSRRQYHLVLNPDVLLAEDCLAEALAFLAACPKAGLLAPAAVDGEGNKQYLCKRYPTVLDLLLRGFAPEFLKKIFKKRLDRYELRDLPDATAVWDVPIVSGCFMLFRHSVLTQLQGFANTYFLYFEDFDLSLRAARLTRIVYVPSVRITHFGGRAARKGWRHIGLFLRSLVIFFNRHGWKWM